jgi:quercetin dioxygenase-like cupin family protein
MNIKDQHAPEKQVSAKNIFEGSTGEVKAIQLLNGGHLKEHITRVPACLICVKGHVVFENEKGLHETLTSGDYIQIEPMVKHWLNGKEDSQLVLVK